MNRPGPAAAGQGRGTRQGSADDEPEWEPSQSRIASVGVVRAAPLLLGMLALPGSAHQPVPVRPGGQPPIVLPGGQGGVKIQGGGSVELPSDTSDELNPYEDDEKTNWVPIIIVGGLIGFIGLIVVLALNQKKKKATGEGGDPNVIAGYRLKNHLMTGQASQVWEVVEEASHRHFAMKLLLPEKAKDKHNLQMLFHEAKVGQEAAHPNIIKIVKVGARTTPPVLRDGVLSRRAA